MVRKHFLVTGGAGFIGSHVVDRLLAGGSRVTAVDNFDGFYPRKCKENNINAHAGNPWFRLIEADICDIAGLAAQFTGPIDGIVHLAAKAGVLPSVKDPVGCQRTNVNGTQSMLELARELGIRRFVAASSSSVYGANPQRPWREDLEILRPVSPYAATKASAELLGHVYSHLYGIQFIALRLFSVYGPRQRPDLAIHKFARRMLEGQPIPLYGDGSSSRDYTFVGDIVSGIMAALELDTAHRYEVINLGNSSSVSLRELVETLEAVLGVKARIERLPAQPGDLEHTLADLGKARAVLGYVPGTNLREGLQAFADWFQAQSETVAF